jgi:hypothetical protein
MSQGVRVPAGLVLPRNAMPNFNCEVCGLQFYDQGEHVRHVKSCVKRNREVIEELAEQNKRRDPLYDATDWEAMAFQRRRYGSPRHR